MLHSQCDVSIPLGDVLIQSLVQNGINVLRPSQQHLKLMTPAASSPQMPCLAGRCCKTLGFHMKPGFLASLESVKIRRHQAPVAGDLEVTAAPVGEVCPHS